MPAEYPKRLYIEGQKASVLVRDAEEEAAALGVAVESLTPGAEPGEMTRAQLVEALVSGFREHLAGLSDDDVRESYDALMGADEPEPEAQGEDPEIALDANPQAEPSPEPADPYPNLTDAQEAALDRIPEDGVTKPGGAPRGGNRKKAAA